MTEETYKKLELVTQVLLNNVLNAEDYSKDEGDAVQRAATMVELLNAADKENNEYYDKQERRQIDKERNEAANRIERDKQRLTFGRVFLEIGKVVIPVIITTKAYDIFQKRLITFETTGRLVSTAAKELHLPNFMRK